MSHAALPEVHNTDRRALSAPDEVSILPEVPESAHLSQEALTPHDGSKRADRKAAAIDADFEQEPSIVSTASLRLIKNALAERALGRQAAEGIDRELRLALWAHEILPVAFLPIFLPVLVPCR
tara:strand:- start:72 stop:440 length:369 start_codon:yes stop_codon:yes gene_type:complete